MIGDPSMPNVCLEGIRHGNRFITRNTGGDQTTLADGTVAYRVLGYANTHEEALDIIDGGMTPEERLVRSTKVVVSEMMDDYGEDIPPELLNFKLNSVALAIAFSEQDKRERKAAQDACG